MATITSTEGYSVGLGGVLTKTFPAVVDYTSTSIFQKVLRGVTNNFSGGEVLPTTGVLFPNGRT